MTGPKSPTGKAKTRLNSLKHGQSALVVPVPGEDPALFQARFDAWRPGLNPQKDEFGDYLLTIVVRKSLNLDRLHVARAARLADRARSAGAARTESRAKEVEDLLKRVQEDCGTASRQLQLTSEGCEALIDEWEHLKAPLLWPPHWDQKDAERIAHLQGRGRIARKEAPHVMVIPTLWIERYRKTVEKLEANEFGDAYDSQYRYHRDADKERDRADLPDMETGARHGVTWIRTVIEAEQRNLCERIEWLKESEAADESEAMLRARLDPSDEGRLLHRYEMDNERGILKLASVLQGRAREWVKEAQHQVIEQVASETSPEPESPAPPADPQNEATATAPTHSVMPIRAVDGDGFSSLPIAMLPPIDPPDRR